MKIPIWLTVKNIYKTIYSNLLSFVSVPTIVLLSLPHVHYYLYYNKIISVGLFATISILSPILLLITHSLVLAFMQEYLLFGDNQLLFNKLAPKFDRRQRRYISFSLYVVFYIYLVPLLFTPLLLLAFQDLYTKPLTTSQSNMTILVLSVLILFFVITYARSLKYSIGASMVHSYISIHTTQLKFKQLIKVSSETLMGNKWQIFFITCMSIAVIYVFGFVIGIFQGMIEISLGSTHTYYFKTLYVVTGIICNYLGILTYASVNVHIYLFFKDQFEANLAKLTQSTNKTEINTNGDKLLLE